MITLQLMKMIQKLNMMIMMDILMTVRSLFIYILASQNKSYSKISRQQS